MINNRKENNNIMCVYKLYTHLDNRIYVGATRNLYERLCEHKSDSKYPYMDILRAIEKYGWDNFEVEILEEVKDKSILREIERFYRESLNSENPEIGWNYKFLDTNSNRSPKPVICINTGIIYASTMKAYKQTGIDRSHICACCMKKAKSAGKLPDGTKLVWRYYEKT